MQRSIIAAATSLLLSTGIIGCSEEDAGNIGKQIGNAAEKATEAASNVAEKATDAASNAAKDSAKIIDQWTDRATSEAKPGNKRADAADQQK
jgi:hypothetical protein